MGIAEGQPWWFIPAVVGGAFVVIVGTSVLVERLRDRREERARAAEAAAEEPVPTMEVQQRLARISGGYDPRAVTTGMVGPRTAAGLLNHLTDVTREVDGRLVTAEWGPAGWSGVLEDGTKVAMGPEGKWHIVVDDPTGFQNLVLDPRPILPVKHPARRDEWAERTWQAWQDDLAGSAPSAVGAPRHLAPLKDINSRVTPADIIRLRDEFHAQDGMPQRNTPRHREE